MVIFYFLLVFMYSISHLYISNIIYYSILIKQIIFNEIKISIPKNNLSIVFFILFVIWVSISSIYYTLSTGFIDSRSIIQFLFTLQYFILIIQLNINYNFFEKYLYFFSILLSFIIIVFFLYLFFTQKSSIASFKDNLMAIKYISGWPNTTALPLIIALWLSFKKNKSNIIKFMFIIAASLTTSRGAYLGIFLIVIYFMIKKIIKKKIYILPLIAGTIISLVLLVYFNITNQDFLTQLTRSFDRIDIFKTTIAYLKLNPLMGYGGNTIDQIQWINIDFDPIKNWGHTHNWILEIMLRYGIIGLALFICFIFSIWYKIKDIDSKYMFAVLLFLALFQTFMRDFVFLFYLSYLCNNKIDCHD